MELEELCGSSSTKHICTTDIVAIIIIATMHSSNLGPLDSIFIIIISCVI